ncbi:hypothetical protein ACH5RR_029416 [Cinchona calisaya]|uniref:RNase H type-1 domain-containing protein n=1 Tax=Cinchona calisaya TaxID=153742 RepID=A0ABD2YV52_9GENT
MAVVWIKPTQQSFMLNVDGSSLEKPGPSGEGGVCRDCYGSIVMAFSQFFSHGTSPEDELNALMVGDKLSKFGTNKISEDFDASSLPQKINGLAILDVLGTPFVRLRRIS